MIFAIALILISALVASAADFNVTVGTNNQLVFDPRSVTVQNGDTVHFEFIFITAAKNSANGTAGASPAETTTGTALTANAPAVTGSGIPSSTRSDTSTPSGSGFSTSNAASTGAASSADSNQNSNGAIVTRDLSSAGVVTIVSLIAALAGSTL